MSTDRLCELLATVHRAGLRRAPRGAMGDLEAAARSCGYSTCRVNLAQAVGKRDLLDRIAHALAFPDWFGGNWDALEDCLADLSWLPPARVRLVLLEHCPDTQPAIADDFETALQVFDAAARIWREQGVAFWIVADTRRPGLPPLSELP